MSKAFGILGMIIGGLIIGSSLQYYFDGSYILGELFGHPSGTKSKTHWLCFMKIPKERKPDRNDQSFRN